MVAIAKEIVQAYTWSNKRVAPTMCLAVPAHSKLYKVSNSSGVLIDFFRQSGCFRSRPISQIGGLGNSCMEVQMAQVQQELLRGYGVDLNHDFYKGHINELMLSYLLYSSLCYVQSEGSKGLDSYYVTKQGAILKELSSHIVPKDLSKLNTDYFADRYKTTISELTEAKHKVVTIRVDADGLHLGKGIIHSNSKNNLIYPVYVLRNYKLALLEVLKNKVVRITCVDSSEESIKFVTSLNGDALCRWLKTNQVNRCQPIWEQIE